MPETHIIFTGRSGSGKTSLVKRIFEDKFSNNHHETIGCDCNEYLKCLKIWDTEDFQLIKENTGFANTLKKANLLIYTIDATRCKGNAAEEEIKKINEDIQEIKKITPKLKVVFVFTKAFEADEDRETIDSVIKQNYKNIFEKIIKPENLTISDEIYITSAKEKKGDFTQLEQLFLSLSSQKSFSKKFFEKNNNNKKTKSTKKEIIDYSSYFNQIAVLDESELKNKFILLKLQTEHYLKASDAKKIGDYTNQLIETLIHEPSKENKENAILTFSKNCHYVLEGKNPKITKTIFTIIAMVSIALAVGTIGFGIGFALGLWSGPGAFFMGILAGSASAAFVLNLGGLSGLTVGGATAYGLFRKSKTTKAVDEVVIESFNFLNKSD